MRPVRVRTDTGPMNDTQLQPAKTRSANVDLVRRTYDAFARGDLDAVVGAMDPDIEWHEAEHSPWYRAGGHHGPEAVVMGVFARIPESFEVFGVDVETILDAGDHVVVQGRYRGTPVRDGAAPLDAQVCHIWAVREGRLAAFQQYTDTWQLGRAVAG